MSMKTQRLETSKTVRKINRRSRRIFSKEMSILLLNEALVIFHTQQIESRFLPKIYTHEVFLA